MADNIKKEYSFEPNNHMTINYALPLLGACIGLGIAWWKMPNTKGYVGFGLGGLALGSAAFVYRSMTVTEIMIATEKKK